MEALIMDEMHQRRHRFSEQERRLLARDIVNELWRRVKEDVGGSVIRRVFWTIIIIALLVGYIKFPFPFLQK
jgi:hypothetical protein